MTLTKTAPISTHKTPVDALVFREGMSRLPSGITLITTGGPAGLHGFTATAVCSVSDAPPTLLVCVNRNTSAHDHILSHQCLAVNVLAEGQEHLCSAFSSRKYTMAERFALARWENGITGAPLLEGAVVSFECRVSRVIDTPTHSIVIATVGHIQWDDTAESGLVWFQKAFALAKK
ncbi:flavin reductase [Acetobacter malorum]|uniref:flavin reductase n=1 Tax=Acetobacter malorum TaxID=178901 RepID=UPI00248F401E|nr:flavin reductase [Acetobacter malorum]